MRCNWAGANGLEQSLFEWALDADNVILIDKNTANNWRIGRFAGGVGTLLSTAASHSLGAYVTLLCAWNKDTLAMSLDGAARTASADANIPALSSVPLADIGDITVGVGAPKKASVDFKW